jgi:hypothetical protein
LKTLSEVDSHFHTAFDLTFNSKHFRDYLSYVEVNLAPDFQNFLNLRTQFDGFSNGTNNTLISIPLITSTLDMKTTQKVTTVVEFTLTYFKEKGHYAESDLTTIEKRLSALLAKLREYLKFLAENHAELLRYCRYQNFICQGGNYIKFEEFEK